MRQKRKPDKRDHLIGLVRLFFLFLLLISIYVLVDYSIDFKPPRIHSSYHFRLNAITEDKPVLLRQDNLTILVIKRSDSMLKSLLENRNDLQDPTSERSRQPDYAQNPLRSKNDTYFVSYATGTDLGCPVTQQGEGILVEVCGTARYDFSGRALESENGFQNLAVPDYNFSDDFKTLTINP